MPRKSPLVQWYLFAGAFALIAGLIWSPGLSASASPSNDLPSGAGLDPQGIPHASNGSVVHAAATASPTATILPSATPQPTTGPTPTATYFARGIYDPKKLYVWYMQLRADIYDLNYYHALVGQYRDTYYHFLLGEQVHHHDTRILEQGLAYFDGLYGRAQAYEKDAIEALAYPVGLGGPGTKLVVNGPRVASDIDYALLNYENSRSYYANAVYVLHSALNLYHQVTGLGTPEIPKLRLPVYCLECRTRVRR